jgi:hypothetical protein
VCTEDLAREKKEKDMHEFELLGLLGRKVELRYYEDGIEKIARQKSSRLAHRIRNQSYLASGKAEHSRDGAICKTCTHAIGAAAKKSINQLIPFSKSSEFFFTLNKEIKCR